MPKNTKKRTQVKDLPKSAKRLTKEEAKKLKGGTNPPSQGNVRGVTPYNPPNE